MKKFVSLILVLLVLTSLCVNVCAVEDLPQVETVTITNCDTGRTIGHDELGQFLFHKISDTEFCLTFIKGGSYVDFTNGEVGESWDQIIYTYKHCGNNRYQIIMPDGKLLGDSGETDGENCSITLYDPSALTIETGWFITSAENVPLRIMFLGDSLTYGVNPDVEIQNLGYRAELTGYLLNYFDRLVAVGSIKEPGLITYNNLLRHSAYPGYVIEDVYGYEDHPGLSDKVGSIVQEAKPDIVIMLLGTNDCGLLTGSTDLDGDIDALVDRWENFIRQITVTLPENGILICCSVPPLIGERDEKFNEKMEERLEELKNSGLKLTFADVYSIFEGNDNYYSSDYVHLSSEGYSAVAEYLFEVITQNYNEDGVKGVYEGVSLNEQPPEESIVESSVPQVQEEVAEETTDYTIFIIFGALVLLMLVAIILLLVFRKKIK